jgi:hypothetical protein
LKTGDAFVWKVERWHSSEYVGPFSIIFFMAFSEVHAEKEVNRVRIWLRRKEGETKDKDKEMLGWTCTFMSLVWDEFIDEDMRKNRKKEGCGERSERKQEQEKRSQWVRFRFSVKD